MTYDEFAAKLDEISAEFLRAKGKPLETVQELRQVLDRRLTKPKKRGVRKLGGMFG